MYIPQGNLVPRHMFEALQKEVEELKRIVEEMQEQKTDEPLKRKWTRRVEVQ
jgi:uncharacterized membrane protein (DUF106 family)